MRVKNNQPGIFRHDIGEDEYLMPGWGILDVAGDVATALIKADDNVIFVDPDVEAGPPRGWKPNWDATPDQLRSEAAERREAAEGGTKTVKAKGTADSETTTTKAK